MKKLILAVLVLLLACSAFAAPNKWLTPPPEQVQVTPSDATIYSPLLKSMYIGVTGDVRVILSRDVGTFTCANAPIHKNHPVGLFRGRIYQACSTGTTATEIIGYPSLP